MIHKYIEIIDLEAKKNLCNCGKMATYFHMPSSSVVDNRYYCDDCVPRGCSCNWHHLSDGFETLPTEEDKPWKWVIQEATEYLEAIPEGKCWVHLDEKGREHPCCEYMWDGDGFDDEVDEDRETLMIETDDTTNN
jgi:hypothetical protein